MKCKALVAFISVVALGTMASVSKADSIAATLTGVNPNEIAGGYYVGQLTWNVVATTNATRFPVGDQFGTYCVDTLHDIYINYNYEFDVKPLSDGTYLGGNYLDVPTATKVQAINALYSDNYFNSLVSNASSSAFQTVVWHILFPSFSPPVYAGLDPAAQSDYTSYLTLLNYQLTPVALGGLGVDPDSLNVMALVADPSPSADDPGATGPIPDYPNQGQDQALVVLPTSRSGNFVPLPATAGVGFSMLAGFGALAAFRKRLSRRPRIA